MSSVLSSKLKGMTRLELMEAMRLPDGGDLSEVLDNLVKCDFIRKYTAIGKTERDALYQLTDLFSLFHMKFVEDNSGQDEHLWSKLTGKGPMTAWSGYAFEQVCLHHTSQIKQALSIGGIISNIHSWSCRPFTDKNGTSWKGGQIDLLIDRADEVISICEIKYVSDKFVIDAEYEKRLASRATLFRQVTKTKKALHHCKPSAGMLLRFLIQSGSQRFSYVSLHPLNSAPFILPWILKYFPQRPQGQSSSRP